MQKVQKKDEHSMFKSEFWGVCCEGGKRYSQVVRQKFHLSMAALDPTVIPTSPCVSLMVERGGSEYMLCSLKPDVILQVTLNLFFDKGEKITFFLKGHGTVHLSGYHIYDESDLTTSKDLKTVKGVLLGQKPDGSFKVETSEEEESEDEDESEEEVVVIPAKKTPTTSPAKPLKKNFTAKTTPKKVEMAEESSEDDDDESEEESDKGVDSKKLKVYAAKRVRSSLEDESSDEEESSEEISSPKKGVMKEITKKLQSIKRLKTDALTPSQIIKPSQKTPNKFQAVNVEDEMNSSIGRTPMPKKKPSILQKPNSLFNVSGSKQNTPNKKAEDSEESSDSDDDMDISAAKPSVPEKKPLPNNELNTSTQSAKSKKKKKKKSKAGANDVQVLENTPEKVGESPAKSKFSKKMPGGLEYDDIRIGTGPVAKKGKLIHVYYTGKLENNKVFDSCQQGSKAFSFKLGAGQVIRGWDLGVEGMKVGGKRKLKVPPSLAYKSQRTGDIPANSTLYFVVELKAVS